MTAREFGDMYPTKEEKIEALKRMSDEEIDELIRTQSNIYGKIFYKKYKKALNRALFIERKIVSRL